MVALSFFSGALGLDLGLEQAGFEPRLASEIDVATQDTIRLNRPNLALIGDLRDYTAPEIKNLAGLDIGDEIDLIAGGPPCQAFSTAGKRLGFKDERGNVFLEFIDLVLELRPRYLVIENVRGLLSAPISHRPHNQRGRDFPALEHEEQSGGALRLILHMLKKAGYEASFNLYNAANFGVPQIRERVVIICSRDGYRVPYLTPTHSSEQRFKLPAWKTFREATAGLDESKMEYIPFPEKRLRYYRLLKAGQNWTDLPMALQKEAMGKSWYLSGGKTGFYRRLAWDKPAPTMVTHPAMPATDLAHPSEDRPLSVQEYKRLQMFPETYEITGSLVKKYRQIGNAVPVSLGKAIGDAIKNHMYATTPKILIDFPYSRYKKTSDKNWMAGSGKPAESMLLFA